MHKRIGVILITACALLQTLPLQAARRSAPSKAYVRANAMYGGQDKAGTMRFWSKVGQQAGAGGMSLGYRVNAFTLYEADYIFAGKDAVLRNSVVLARKELIPLQYPFNIALHYGGALKFDNKAKLVFGGIGLNYMTPKLFYELYYRYYRIPDLDWFKPIGETPRRVHAVVFSIGRHFE